MLRKLAALALVARAAAFATQHAPDSPYQLEPGLSSEGTSPPAEAIEARSSAGGWGPWYQPCTCLFAQPVGSYGNGCAYHDSWDTQPWCYVLPPTSQYRYNPITGEGKSYPDGRYCQMVTRGRYGYWSNCVSLAKVRAGRDSGCGGENDSKCYRMCTEAECKAKPGSQGLWPYKGGSRITSPLWPSYPQRLPGSYGFSAAPGSAHWNGWPAGCFTYGSTYYYNGNPNGKPLGSVRDHVPVECDFPERFCMWTYCNRYADLKNAFCGGGECTTLAQAEQCFAHWTTYGKREGRHMTDDGDATYVCSPYYKEY